MCDIRSYALAILVIVAGMAASGNATAASLQVKRAFYSVPVSPELASFATIDLKDVEAFETDEGLSFKYTLPPELVGPDTKAIQLTQQNKAEVSDLHKMMGRQENNGSLANVAEASCGKHPLQEKKLQCMIVYHSLTIDSQKAKQFLEENYEGSSGFAKRLQIAAFFANEPSGILVIELK